MSYMFRYCISFDQYIGDWDVTNVVNMRAMFRDATVFNQDISLWNVTNSSSANFDNMFRDATKFAQHVRVWNLGNTSAISNMFNGATAMGIQYSGATGYADTPTVATFFRQKFTPANNADFVEAIDYYLGNSVTWPSSYGTDIAIGTLADSYEQNFIKYWDMSKVSNVS